MRAPRLTGARILLTLAPVAALLILLTAAPPASADTGALTGQGCIQDVGKADCSPNQQGLAGAWGVAVSPDGKSVYTASFTDDALARFDREPMTGALTPQGCIADVGDLAGCGTTQQGLDRMRGVAVSPDGKSVYVTSTVDDAIARFDRAADGSLTPQGCIQDVGKADCGPTQQGLDGAFGVTVSPDGKSVYVASSSDDAIVRFDRAADGSLTPQGCIQDVESTAGCGPTQQGLAGAQVVAVSPDGTSVYVDGFTDDAIVRFDRAGDGALTPQGCIADVGDVAGCGATQQGLDSAEAVAVSPDGKSVYVASHDDDATVRFDRAVNGALTPAGCIADVGDVAGCGATQQGLDGPEGVAVSPDGKSVYVSAFVDDAIVNFNREDPPETQIDSGPEATTTNPSPAFTFSSDEQNVSFECQVNGASFGACSGPGASHTTAQLTDGPHTFEVRARDAFGTADPTPASRSFTVDTTPPPDILPPDLELAGKKVQRVRRAVAVKATCTDEPCTAAATGVLKVRNAPKSAATAAATRKLKLKPTTDQLAVGEQQTLKLKLKKKARKAATRALKRDGKAVAKIMVTATDALGNSISANRKIKLKD